MFKNPQIEIKQIIEQYGAISVAKFMEIAISYYYANNHVFGKDGDFITAPEVSQMFGEVVGAYIALKWLELGNSKIDLIEIGPGRGTLMADILRATKSMPNFHNSISRICLVESSKKLRQTQALTLAEYKDKISWHNDLHFLNSRPAIFIANEFFDALPIEQYINGKERMIVSKDGKLCFESNGDITETSKASTKIISTIAQHIKQFSGACFIADYGYIDGNGDTLQALKNHQYHNIFDDIGNADLTAHVNFKDFRKTFQNAGLNPRIETQAEFLIRNGIILRAAALSKNTDPLKIKNDLERLISETQMGTLFKVLTCS